MLDTEIFPWLENKKSPSKVERHRASTIVADRLCGAVSDPIVRNAHEKRQLTLLGDYLKERGYIQKGHPPGKPLTEMERGSFAFRMIIEVGETLKVNIPVDVVIQPKVLRQSRLPILIEAKSAGDFTNVNKRRKEEATKMRQLRSKLGKEVEFLLFLCGYFDSGYLGYEAAEGIDWVWEHRIQDLDMVCSPKTGPGAMRVFRPIVARRTLDETDATQSRADHQKAAGRGWHVGGRPDNRRSLPSPGHQRANVPAVAAAVRRHEGGGGAAAEGA
jgi:hypothetical protein